MKNFLREYSRHTALNLGQAVRDFRFFYYHPDVDKVAVEGTLKHLARSVPRRARSLANNLFYSVVPPHFHHTKTELRAMKKGRHTEWFLYGYKPWEFADPSKR